MRDGVYARIVSESAIHQNFKCPLRSRSYGVTLRPVNPRPNSAGLLNGDYRPLGIGFELGGSHVIGKPMGVAVTANFVARASNLPD